MSNTPGGQAYFPTILRTYPVFNYSRGVHDHRRTRSSQPMVSFSFPGCRICSVTDILFLLLLVGTSAHSSPHRSSSLMLSPETSCSSAPLPGCPSKRRENLGRKRRKRALVLLDEHGLVWNGKQKCRTRVLVLPMHRHRHRRESYSWKYCMLLLRLRRNAAIRLTCSIMAY